MEAETPDCRVGHGKKAREHPEWESWFSQTWKRLELGEEEAEFWLRKEKPWMGFLPL
jgi:hypothetical protein